MPSVLEVVKAQSSRNRPDRSIECIEFFEALLLSYPRIICSNLKNVIDGLLRAAIFLNVNEISCRFIDVISAIVSYRTKVRNVIFSHHFLLRLLLMIKLFSENSQGRSGATNAMSNNL